MISKALILANGPDNLGEQVHINHDGCSAGTDTKRRLYIKRVERGLLAYCHHCSEKAFVRDTSSRLSSWITKSGTVTALKPLHPTTVFTDELSLEAKMWLLKYWCDPKDTKFFQGVKGRPTQAGLVLYDPEWNIKGMQIRNLTPEAKPKYITKMFDSINKDDACWFVKKPCFTLVITEDYLSAYRIYKDAGCSSVALLKTSVSDRTLATIAEVDPISVYVWLDPDDAGIKGAKEAVKKLSYYLPKSTVVQNIGSELEPKECNKEDIKLCL